MTIVHWEALRDIAAHQEWTAQMLEGCYASSELAQGSWVPAVDIYSTIDREVVLKAELPDMKQDEIKLTVLGNTLTLSGERKLDTVVTTERFHRIERSFGSFSRSFTLPPTIDAGNVRAEYNAGILTVRLPLREEAKPTHIKVDVAA
jgi:HSP20 family protein